MSINLQKMTPEETAILMFLNRCWHAAAELEKVLQDTACDYATQAGSTDISEDAFAVIYSVLAGGLGPLPGHPAESWVRAERARWKDAHLVGTLPRGRHIVW